MGCISPALAPHIGPNVHQTAFQRRGDRHDRTDQVSSASPALPTLEIPIGGRGTSLARTEDVFVHTETHRAAWIAPFETGFGKNPVEPFALRRGLDLLRSGHHHRAHP